MERKKVGSANNLLFMRFIGFSFLSSRYSGYWALCAAVNRALEEGHDLTDPHYVKDIDISTVTKVFRSATSHSIPLLEERHRILRQHASTLIEVR